MRRLGAVPVSPPAPPPVRSARSSDGVKKGEGARDVTLRFAEVTIVPGDYLYADVDGVVVADKQLH